VLDAIQHLRAEKLATMEVRPEVQAAYVADVQAALPGTVYNAGCATYYLDENGYNSFSWPWSTVRMRRRLHAFDPAAYTQRAQEAA
jgi:hypothetical protein